MNGDIILVAWGQLLGRSFHKVLINQVQEHTEGFTLEDHPPGRLIRVRIEVLMDGSCMNQYQVSGIPFVHDAIVDFIPFPLKDVQNRFILMSVFFRFSPWSKINIMEME
jgi:hypothetical protein